MKNNYYHIRKKIVVIPIVSLVSNYAREACKQNKGLEFVNISPIRGLNNHDSSLQKKIINSIISHPNILGALLITNDHKSSQDYKNNIKFFKKPVETISLLGSKGSKNFFINSKQKINKIKLKLKNNNKKKKDFLLTNLCVALECGGSDQTSGLFTNPVIGMFVDYLIENNATVIISETAEFIGTENIINKSTINKIVAKKIINRIKLKNYLMIKSGIDYKGINPTEENLNEGITTLVEKSLGAIKKAGKCNFTGFLEYAEKPKKPGLYFMDTPFYTPISFTGLMSAGSHVNLFGMGSFNPSSNSIVPTIRICSNPNTIKRWGNKIDVDLSSYFKKGNLEQAYKKLKEHFIKIIKGKLTISEKEKSGEIILPTSSFPL